jgi:hypothetical protein
MVEHDDYIRADDREHAKEIIRRKYPQATFYGKKEPQS